MKRARTRAAEAADFEIKRLMEHLKRLRAAFNVHSVRLEWTLTPFTKLKPPKGYRLMDPTWSYAECPKCKSVADTYLTSKDDPDIPCTYYDYFCAICGETWKNTKIWD